MSDIEIREAREGEYRTEAKDLAHAAWRGAYRHILPLEAIDAHYAGDLDVSCDYWPQRGERLAVFVALKGETLVGVVGLGTYAGGEGEVRSMYVAPEFQGQGIGQRLWQRAERFFRERGVPAVNVWTLAQAGSCRFYEAMGCEPLGTGTLFLGELSAPCVHYRRELSS